MPAFQILIVIVVVALVVAGAIYSHRQHKQRQVDLAQLGSELGWQFDPSKNYGHDDAFDQFGIFTTGKSRYAYNTLRGMLAVDGAAWPGQMGDYHYQTTSGTGKNRRTTTHLFSYLIVEMPYPSVPSLKIRREHLFDRVASFIGFDDIDFESAEFSDRFHVKSSDKRFAYAIIHPRMMQFLLADDPPTVNLKGGHCCIFTESKCWSPAAFRANVTWLQEFFSLWPRHITSVLQS